MIYPVLYLFFHLSSTLGSVANSNLDLQADELLLSGPLSSPSFAEPNTALLIAKQAGTNDEWGLVATDPSNAGDIEEAPFVQSTDQCPYDSTQNPRKSRFKRGGSSCSPLLIPDQSQPVRDSNQINTGRTPEVRLNSGQNSRMTGKPSRQWKKAPVPGELYKDTDLCEIAHPWPMCATMEVRRIDDGLTIPLDDFSGRWEHEYCRPLPRFLVGCDPALGEDMWCCHWAFKYKGGADAHPDKLRLLYPNICIACVKMNNVGSSVYPSSP